MPFWDRFFSEHRHTEDSTDLMLENVRAGKAVVLDVRSPDERNAGFIQGSIFVDFDLIQAFSSNAEWLKQLPTDKIIYCHCKAGVRAAIAAGKLVPLGFDIRTVPFSYQALVEFGFPGSQPD